MNAANIVALTTAGISAVISLAVAAWSRGAQRDNHKAAKELEVLKAQLLEQIDEAKRQLRPTRRACRGPNQSLNGGGPARSRRVVIAVLDESSPYAPDGMIISSLGAVVMDAAEHARLSVDLPLLLDRQRPFHWERDKGPEIRRKVVDVILGSPLTVVVAACRCGRSDLAERHPPNADR